MNLLRLNGPFQQVGGHLVGPGGITDVTVHFGVKNNAGVETAGHLSVPILLGEKLRENLICQLPCTAGLGTKVEKDREGGQYLGQFFLCF